MDYFNTHYVKCDGRVTWKELYVEMLEQCHKRAEEMDRLVIGATNYLSPWSELPERLRKAHRYRLEEQKHADARFVTLLNERGLGQNKRRPDQEDGRKPTGETKREREKRIKEERGKTEVHPATRAKNGPCPAWAKNGSCTYGVI